MHHGEMLKMKAKYQKLRAGGLGKAGMQRLKLQLEQEPENADLLWQLGRGHLNQREFGDAVGALDRAVAAGLRSAELWRALGDARLGSWRQGLELERGLLEGAVEAYGKAMQGDTYAHDPALLLQLVEVYKFCGQLEGAQSLVARMEGSFKGCKELPAARHSLAAMCKVRSEWAKAKAALQAILDRPPPPYKRWHIALQLGRTCEQEAAAVEGKAARKALTKEGQKYYEDAHRDSLSHLVKDLARVRAASPR